MRLPFLHLFRAKNAGRRILLGENTLACVLPQVTAEGIMKKQVLALFLVLFLASWSHAEWRWIGPGAGSIEELTPDRANSSLWFAVDDGFLYRSTDAGRSWKSTGLRDVGHQGYYPVRGGAVTIIPATSEILVSKKSGPAATDLWKSQDHGKTFQFLCTAPFTLLDIVPDPTDPKVLYGAALTNFGIVVSYDGGKKWSVFNNLPLPAEPHPGCSGYDVDEAAVAVSPFRSGTVFVSGVLSFICGPESDSESFFLQTSNGGRSWSPVDAGSSYFHSDPAFPDRLFAFASSHFMIFTKTGWKDLPPLSGLNQLVSVPRHANELLAFAQGLTQKILRSTDTGNTWRETSVGSLRQIELLAALDDPFGGVLAGTHGAGIYFRDAKHNWTSANGGIRNSNIRDVQGASSMLYALSSNGFLFSSRNGGALWELPFGPKGPLFSGMSVDPTNPGHVVVVGDSIRTSRDGGVHWIQATLDGATKTVSFAAAIDPTDSRIVYVAKGNSYGLFKSTDGGDTFKSLSPRFPSKGYEDITRIVVDPNDGRIVYFVVPYFGIFKSTDGGATVKPAVNGISPPCPDCNSNPAIDLVPLAPRDAYLCVTMQGKLYRTHDAGEHWQLVGQGPLKSFVDRLFVADGMGQHQYMVGGLTASRLYESTDGGATWTNLTGQFGSGAEVSILTNPRQVPLYAATNHGVYQLQ